MKRAWVALWFVMWAAICFVAGRALASDELFFHLEAESIDGTDVNGPVKYNVLAGFGGKYAPVTLEVPRSAWGGKSPRLDTIPQEYRNKAMAEAYGRWVIMYHITNAPPFEAKK